MMALETERCSPQNASSPGPNEVTQNPGTNGGSSSGYTSPMLESKSKSAFHQIALLSQKYIGDDGEKTDVAGRRRSYPEYPPPSFQNKPVSICSPLQSRCPPTKDSPSPPEHHAKDVPDGVTASPYDCHKFNPEFYISQIQNFPGLPFHPFVFPSRLPLKMQMYGAPNFNFTAGDYMLGLHNAKLMCEMLQMQQNNNVPFERPRKASSEDVDDVSSRSVFTSPVTGAGSDYYSRPDSPCSSVTSGKYYPKRCSCSPSSKGVPSRSPSPMAQQCGAPLPFSVDNILRPEFGKSARGTAAKTAAPPVKESVSPAAVSRKPKTSRCEKSAADDSASLASTKDSMSPRLADYDDQSGDKTTDDPLTEKDASGKVWPAWVFCTRYSDRPSSGPRSRRVKRTEKKPEEKRPRTAFSGEQLSRLKKEFAESKYLNEKRRQELATELGLQEAQIKIWFQNKRAKIKKSSGKKNPLALKLMAQGLYNHSTVAMSDDEMMDDYSNPAQPTTALSAQ